MFKGMGIYHVSRRRAARGYNTWQATRCGTGLQHIASTYRASVLRWAGRFLPALPWLLPLLSRGWAYSNVRCACACYEMVASGPVEGRRRRRCVLRAFSFLLSGCVADLC